MVGTDAEGRILLGQALQGQAHLFLVGLGLRLNRNLDNRLREGNRLEDNRVGRIGQCVTGGGAFQTNRRGNLAGVDLLDLLTTVGMHAQDATDALLLAGAGVENVGAAVERAGVDPEEDELSNERVAGNLKGQTSKRLLITG